MARMATLDRTIMRIAVFELMYRPDIPTSVAISEAVEAATELSSDESRRYVNGILGRIARELGGRRRSSGRRREERERSTQEAPERDAGEDDAGFGLGGLRTRCSVDSVGSSTLPSLMPFLNSPWARPTERAISGSFFAPNSTTTAMRPTTIHSGPIYPTTFHIGSSRFGSEATLQVYAPMRADGAICTALPGSEPAAMLRSGAPPFKSGPARPGRERQMRHNRSALPCTREGAFS